ncbi:MAG: hypothetical protein IJG83_05555 [Thermoguttaceae bacterium]|nr:hypothetical protein [Thermoguttaceae bacterium]
MSVAADLAQAITSDLKEQFDSQTCSVMLALVPRSNLKALHDKTIIMVCPRKLETEEDNRGVGAVYRVSVDVGILRQCSVENTAISELMNVVEDVFVFLRKKTLTGFPQAKWISATNKPIYDPQKILNESMFFSIVSATYILRGK